MFDHSRDAIGHFTALVQDRSYKIGCAMGNFVDRLDHNDLTSSLFGCNYSFTNLTGTPVYQVGPPASKCPHGKDKRYPGLCLGPDMAKGISTRHPPGHSHKKNKPKKEEQEADAPTKSKNSKNSKPKAVAEEVIPEEDSERPLSKAERRKRAKAAKKAAAADHESHTPKKAKKTKPKADDANQKPAAHKKGKKKKKAQALDAIEEDIEAPRRKGKKTTPAIHKNTQHTPKKGSGTKNRGNAHKHNNNTSQPRNHRRNDNYY